MNPMRFALFTALISGLTGCGGSAQEEPEESRPIVRHEVVRDTQYVVIQETLRTMVADTVRTVVADTQRAVFLDTVRTVLIESPQPSEAGSPVANADGSSLSEEEIRAATQELKMGRVSPETIAVLTDGIPSYTTVNVGELDSVQLVQLRSLVRLDESGLTKVRWGNLMAPEGSPDYKVMFVTVWTTAGDLTTVKIRSPGT